MVKYAGYFTLVMALCIVAVALFVGFRARAEVSGGNAPVYRVRKYYAAVLIVMLAGVLLLTLSRVAYTDYSSATPAVRVSVTGRMWSWTMQRSDAPPGELVLPVGKVIEFEVTAADVNHGFGIYDDDGHIIGQTQAMPRYTNHLRLVFDKPGRYHVVCLEYCGLVHQTMMSEFTVE